MKSPLQRICPVLHWQWIVVVDEGNGTARAVWGRKGSNVIRQRQGKKVVQSGNFCLVPFIVILGNCSEEGKVSTCKRVSLFTVACTWPPDKSTTLVKLLSLYLSLCLPHSSSWTLLHVEWLFFVLCNLIIIQYLSPVKVKYVYYSDWPASRETQLDLIDNNNNNIIMSEQPTRDRVETFPIIIIM